jgi:hypothetical protein
MKLNLKSKITIILALFSLLALMIFLVNRPTPISEDIEEEVGTDISTHAVILNPTEIFNLLEGDIRYDMLAKDLRTFAVTTVGKYDGIDGIPVVFNIDSDIKVDNSVIEFRGRFARSNDNIEIKIELRNNQRIKLSVTNLKTNLSINESLESNSLQNEYIASLPIETSDYIASYNIASNKVVFDFKQRDASLTQKTKQFLSDKFSDGSYESDYFIYSYPNMSVAP